MGVLEGKGTCGGCEFWEESTFKERVGYGECGNDNFAYGTPYDEKNFVKLFCMDAEGYNASIYVGKDFACIHWEEKKERCKCCQQVIKSE
jgi:hypothetical protein